MASSGLETVEGLPAGATITTSGATAMPRGMALGATEYGLIALQAIFWGSTFFFVAIARPHLPALTLGALRLIPAVLLLLAVVTVYGLRLPATTAEWRRMLIFSFLNNVLPFALIATAQREMTGGIAAIFMATAPLVTLLLAPWLIADERFTWRRMAGIVIGIVGVAVLTGAGGAGTGATGTWHGRSLLLLATASFSVATIYARKTLGGYHPFALASAQTIGSLALSAPLALIIDRPWHLPDPGAHVWLAALVMGTVGSGLAPLCYFTVLRRAGAVNAMLSSIVVPVTPVLLGWAFLGEHLSRRELFGGVIIASALVVIDGRIVAWAWRRLGRTKRPDVI